MSKPKEVVVGEVLYTLRQFQSGPGHDWLRVSAGPPATHKSANMEVNRLVDEIVDLRAGMDTAELQRRLRIADRVMCNHTSKEHLPREDRTNPYGPWRCMEPGCGFNSGQHSDWWEPPLEETR